MTSAVLSIASAMLMAGCTTLAPSGATEAIRPAMERHAVAENVSIPDGDAHGVVLGPLAIPDDGGTIHGVVLALDIAHSYTGDLQVRLGYDDNGDGVCEQEIPVELYRARPGSPEAHERFAYPDMLDGVYYFRDTPGQAGQPDPIADPGTPSFGSFDGMKKGGRFYLTVMDTLARETGRVRGWAIYLSSPVAVTSGIGRRAAAEP